MAVVVVVVVVDGDGVASLVTWWGRNGKSDYWGWPIEDVVVLRRSRKNERYGCVNGVYTHKSKIPIVGRGEKMRFEGGTGRQIYEENMAHATQTAGRPGP